MELTLHVADDNGLINLGGIVPPGAHYTATRNDNTGVVRLVPVKVATTATKRIHDPYNSLPDAAQVETTEVPPETPWDEQ